MPKVEYYGEGNWAFHCPGCGYMHAFRVGGDLSKPQWTWNEDANNPTFKPSLLVNQSFSESRCHLFVKDGQIQYLDDCHHRLAGQTVEMEEVKF